MPQVGMLRDVFRIELFRMPIFNTLLLTFPKRREERAREIKPAKKAAPVRFRSFFSERFSFSMSATGS